MTVLTFHVSQRRKLGFYWEVVSRPHQPHLQSVNKQDFHVKTKWHIKHVTQVSWDSNVMAPCTDCWLSLEKQNIMDVFFNRLKLHGYMVHNRHFLHCEDGFLSRKKLSYVKRHLKKITTLASRLSSPCRLTLGQLHFMQIKMLVHRLWA